MDTMFGETKKIREACDSHKDDCGLDLTGLGKDYVLLDEVTDTEGLKLEHSGRVRPWNVWNPRMIDGK